MMGDLVIGGVAGALAGLVFFGGLRWTVSRLAEATRPSLLVTVSFLLRSAVAVSILLLATDGRLVRVLAGLGGMLVVRTVMVSAVRRSLDPAEGSSWT